MAANFWDDPKKAESVLRSIKSHKIWIDDYQDVNTTVEDLVVLSEFHQTGDVSEEELEERNRLRQKTEERREIYDKYHKELLYAVAGKQDVQTQKIGHGDVSVEGDSLFDGIFKSKDKRIAISTFPAHSNKAMLTEYLTNATRELAGGAVNKVIIVLFERKDEDEIVKSLEKQ
ncbi:MAG: hypothetical protein IH946_11120, partial [Bacteroidetes bacterium]|nr:hypothetical protein [Bacteroidota bacterium]